MSDENEKTTRRRFLKGCGVVGVGALVGSRQITSVAHGGKLPIDSIYPDFYSGASDVERPVEDLVRVRLGDSERTSGSLLLICYDYHTKEPICWDSEPYDMNKQRQFGGRTKSDISFDGRVSIRLPIADEFEETDSTIVYVAYESDSKMKDVKYVGETLPINVEDKSAKYLDTMRGDVTRRRDRFVRSSSGGNYSLRYSWRGRDFEDRHAAFNISMFGHYHDTNRERHMNTVVYNNEKTNPLARHIGKEVTDPEDTETKQIVDVASFVQNIPYFYDRDSSNYLEYPKYIRELLVHGGGDCSDTATLLAAIYEQEPFNYDTILVYPPFHVSPAVKIDDIPDSILPYQPHTIEFDGNKYAYIESTEPQSIGDMSPFKPSEIRAIYDGNNWSDINGDVLVDDGVDSIKRYLTQSY